MECTNNICSLSSRWKGGEGRVKMNLTFGIINLEKYILKISVIFTTYNSPAWLEKVLWGYNNQTDKNFEVVVADDGSTQETTDLIEKFKQEANIEVKHVWQEDDGFQKCRILNKAIIASTGEYLIFSDGDCIPRKDFVEVHRMNAKPNHFLSGGYFKLPMDTSKQITKDDILNENCFDKEWLVQNGVKPSIKFMKLTAKGWKAKLYNHITVTNKTFNGHNSSCFKSDALKANGFDERMRYGGLDCEFGRRLKNANVNPIQIRYSAVCVHLDHPRGYVNDEDWKRNREILAENKSQKLIATPAGIQQH